MKKIAKHKPNKRKFLKEGKKKKIRRKKQSKIYYDTHPVADGIRPRPGYNKL